VARLCVAFRESERFGRPTPYKKIEDILGIDAKTVWIHWRYFQRHGLSDVDNGRSSILRDEQLEQIVNFAMEQFFAIQPVTWAWLLYFIHSEYALDVGADTLPRALERDQRIRTCPGRPMETQRGHVRNEALMEYFLMLRDAIDDIPATLIWNMDEIHCSDWADAH
jgi:hypothetical protein